MNKYLIYYANQDSYEGQNQPFAIVNSKSRAEKIVKEIQLFGQNLAEKMLNPFEEGVPDEEYSRRSDENHQLRTETKWPYGWGFDASYFDFERAWSNNDGPEKMIFVTQTVALKELPVL